MSPPRRTISQKSELVQDVHVYGVNWDTREIYLHPHNNNTDGEVDWNMAQQLIKNLTFLSHLNKNKEPVLIHMITSGGEWEYGWAIYDAILQCQCPVSILAYGLATSISSLMFQAADYRVLMPSTEFHIHFGTCPFSSDDQWKSVQSNVLWHKRSIDILLDVYAEKAQQGQYFKSKKWGLKRIKNYIIEQITKKQEWYMTPREAINMGFADAILGDDGYENVAALLKSEE